MVDRVGVGYLVVGRKRPGFDTQWGQQITEAAQAASPRMEGEPFWIPTKAVDAATLAAAIDEARHAGCQVLVVLQPTMGDGRLAPMLAQAWNGPIVFWATPERPDGPKVSSCSLVGAHLFASTLRQLGRPFEIAYGHPEAPQTVEEVNIAIRLAWLGTRLKTCRVGLVGQHAPGFINLHADPALLHRKLGMAIYDFGLEELIERIETQQVAAVAQDVAAVAAMGLPLEAGLGPDDLEPNSRFYLAMHSLIAEQRLDALAVRCWPELPNRVGHWPYLAMSRLAQEGSIVALEGDLYGAVSCLVGSLLGLGPGYLSDWLEHDGQTVTLWHAGHAPLAWCEPGTARLGRHFNDQRPLVINARLAVGRPVTLYRLWPCDHALHMTALQGTTLPPRRELLGAHGLVHIPDRDLRPWFDQLCHEGMPHHVVVVWGHQAALLQRAARQLGVRWIEGR